MPKGCLLLNPNENRLLGWRWLGEFRPQTSSPMGIFFIHTRNFLTVDNPSNQVGS